MPPPPIDAQLGRLPAKHAKVTMAIHLKARQIMLMTLLHFPRPAGQARATGARETRVAATHAPCTANNVLAAFIPLPLIRKGSRGLVRGAARTTCGLVLAQRNAANAVIGNEAGGARDLG